MASPAALLSAATFSGVGEAAAACSADMLARPGQLGADAMSILTKVLFDAEVRNAIAGIFTHLALRWGSDASPLVRVLPLYVVLCPFPPMVRMIDAAVDYGGRLDALFNNAGNMVRAPIEALARCMAAVDRRAGTE